MNDSYGFFNDVLSKVPAYKDFITRKCTGIPSVFEDIPISNKKEYLLQYNIKELCWNGDLGNCHLIGSSSGFSKSGSVFWPKQPEDEHDYMNALETMLSNNYGIDQRKTLIFCCMALGSWIGGMTITSTLRVLAAQGRLPITISTSGLNIAEAVEIYSRFYKDYEQVLWITNPSNINLIYALLHRKEIEIPPKSNFFPVVGEYFTEEFRENIGNKFGFGQEEPFVVWTGYGSADTGDIAVETKETVTLRKLINRNPGLKKQVFNTQDTPMILALDSKPFIEIINNQIIVTKDQLVPLIRYNTGDEGGLLSRENLRQYTEIPATLVDSLPADMLFVFGRATDSIIFYGTNLNIRDIHNNFLFLPENYGYEGLFQVKATVREGISSYNFNIFARDYRNIETAANYQKILIEFLKGRSIEFRTKYTNLSSSAGYDLITVTLDDIRKMEGNIKHKFILD